MGAKKGGRLCIEYRMDENQVLDFSLRLADQPEGRFFEARVENPLRNVVNPLGAWVKIQHIEEELRGGRIPAADIPDTLVQVARLYAEIQQLDKAIDYLSRAMRMKNQPDGYILNLMGIYHGERGDYLRQERCYLEAAENNAVKLD